MAVQQSAFKINQMSQIREKTVLITGGASGIGLLMGRILLREGAGCLIIWDKREDALQEAVSSLKAQGYQVLGYAVDLSDTTQMLRTLQEMQQASLHIDILINNAGIVVGKEFTDHSTADIERTMQVNALAPMLLTRSLLPKMIQQGSGHIINIASAAGMVANPKMSVYCASKWSLIGWSDSLRIELAMARTGVQVTTVTPYYINTGMFEGVRSPLIPISDPLKAAERIVGGIRKNRMFVRLPAIIYLLPLIKGLLPARWFDLVIGKWMGIYRSMEHFKGRN